MRAFHGTSIIVVLLLSFLLLPCEAIPQAVVMTGVTDPAELAALEKLPSCMANAQAGYSRPPKSPANTPSKCVTTIDRANPIAPVTFVVPPATIVYVMLYDTRQNENVTFVPSATKTTTPDTGAAIVKNIIPGLQAITATQPIQATNKHGFFKAQAGPPPAVKSLSDNITHRQQEIIRSTNAVLHSVQSAAAVMNCLSLYEVPNPIPLNGDDTVAFSVTEGDTPPPNYSCSQQQMIARPDFPNQKELASELVQRATTLPLRLLDVADLDTVVKSFYLTCLTFFADMGQTEQDAGRRYCRSYGETLSTNEALLDTAITDIQKAQDTLIQNVQTLNYWLQSNGSPERLVYKFTIPKHVNVTVTIAGTEVVSKVNSTIATVTINQTANAVVVSAGIGFSNLKFNTFTASPIIVNGQPVLDPSGKATTQVVGNATDFSVITPEVLVSYRIGPLSHFLWQTKKCPNGCSFLISGGVGANLTTKQADFDVGPSFQVGGFLFTPTIHIGRDVRLSDGVSVGQMLGSSPPSTLPTTTSTVIKWGIVFSYSLPIP